MIFKISFFLTLTLALSSLDAVTARPANGGKGTITWTIFDSSNQCNYPVDSNSFVVALSQAYNVSSNCRRKVRVTDKSSGHTDDYTVVDFSDQANNDLVLSEAGYKALAPLDSGRTTGTWHFLK